MTTKPNREIDADTEKLTEEAVPEKLKPVAAGGYANMPSVEAIPKLVLAANQTVYKGQTNAAIVMGNDTVNSLSGYGPKGDTNCGAMSIVCGYGPLNATPTTKVTLNNTKDAAKIYISAKSDPDKDFNLKAGVVGRAKGRSSVVLKADALRFISRDAGISLRTGTDRINSQGAPYESITGIELVAGDKVEEIQPMVKGTNLTEALGRLTDHLDKLNGIVDHLLTTQMNFNESLTHHFHYSPWYGNATTPSDAVVSKGIKTMIDFLQETKRSLVTHKTNLVNFKQTYLMASGDKYINSRWNSVN